MNAVSGPAGSLDRPYAGGGGRRAAGTTSLPASRHRGWWWLAGGLWVALRLGAVRAVPVDSDEPQHLHVVWNLVGGLLPYRDFFDNHAPLFSWLSEPGMRLVGERADVLVWARLAMVPLGAAYLLATGWLAAALSGGRGRAVFWAVWLTAFCPGFWFPAAEYRPDLLWAALWVAALACWALPDAGSAPAPPGSGGGGGVRAGLARHRTVLGGVALGLAAATSLKTVVLAASLALAGVLAATAGRARPGLSGAAAPAAGTERDPGPRRGGSWSSSPSGRGWVGAAAGALLAPGAVVLFFLLRGAGGPLWECVVAHNAAPGLGAGPWLVTRRWLLLAALPALAWAAWRAGGREASARGRRQLFVALAAGTYPVLLGCLWPLIPKQDLLPAVGPLAAVLAAAAARRRPGPPRGLAALLATGVAVAVLGGPPWADHTAGARRLLAETLRLTRPGEFLLDAKGETIFRPRPVYEVFESITLARRQGRGQDQEAPPLGPRLAQTGTPVVHPVRLNRADADFVRAHYLPVGQLFALGQRLPAPGSDGSVRFTVVVPARYVVLSGSRPVAGELDGQPLSGGRFLAPGPHAFRPADPAGGDAAAAAAATAPTAARAPLVLFWAEGFARGFVPGERRRDAPPGGHPRGPAGQFQRWLSGWRKKAQDVP